MMDLCVGNTHWAQTSLPVLEVQIVPKTQFLPWKCWQTFPLSGSEDLFGGWKTGVGLWKVGAELLQGMAQAALSLQPGTPTARGDPRIPGFQHGEGWESP